MVRPIYRGQADENWGLESGIIRRLKKTYDPLPPNEQDCLKLVQYHQNELLTRQKIIGTEHATDEKILSELQHHGAATQLLDFTKDPLVALWFACSDVKYSDIDGKLFITDIGSSSYFTNGRDIEWLKELPQRYVFYEPVLSLGNRILIQKSIFVVCSPYISETICKVITISANDKAKICQELELMGVSEEELFPDLPGVAECNKWWKPFKHKYAKKRDPLTIRREGNKAFRNKLFKLALTNFKELVDLESKNFEAYWLAGNAHAELKEFEKAIEYYSEAIRLIKKTCYLEPWFIHFYLGTYFFNRGNSNAALNKHKEAIKDFTEVIENTKKVTKNDGEWIALLKRLERDAQYNMGNSQYLCELYSDAIVSFTRAGGENRSDTCLGMGNTFLARKDYVKAQNYYSIGQEKEPKSIASQCTSNALLLRDVYNKAKMNKWVPFIGNRGNFGNWGSETGVGGTGYPGLKGPLLNVDDYIKGMSIK